MAQLFAWDFLGTGQAAVTDLSGNSRGFTPTGNNTRTSVGGGYTYGGARPNAVGFHQTSSDTQIGPAITGLNVSPRTLCGWAMITGSANGWVISMDRVDGANPSGTGVFGIYNNSGAPQFRCKDNSGSAFTRSFTGNAAYRFYALTYDGTNLKVYQSDGAGVVAQVGANIAMGSVWDATRVLLLQAMGTGATLSDWQGFDTAKTLSELQTLANTPLTSGTTPVSATRATTWRVTAPVVATRATTWDVLSARTATRATNWDVLVGVAATRATTWRTLTTVTGTRATTWRVVARATGTRATTWDVLTPVTATRATTWRTTSRVTASRATTWDTLAALTATRSTTWRTAAQITSTRATTWRTRATVTGSRATTWRVRSAVTATRSTTWDVASTISTVVATRITTWAVGGKVTATRATAWDTLTGTTAQRGTTWRTRQQVGAGRNTTWRVRAVATGPRSTTWDVTSQVALTRIATWDALASLATTRTTTWRTLARTTASRTTTWTVDSNLGPPIESVLTATNDHSSGLTVAHPQPSLSVSNARSSQLEVSHGV